MAKDLSFAILKPETCMLRWLDSFITFSLFAIMWYVRVLYIYCTFGAIRMFYIRYLTMHKVHMHAGAIRQLVYGCAYVREIIHSLKLVDYLPVHTHKSYNNLHLFY